jgi:hypothetical protein
MIGAHNQSAASGRAHLDVIGPTFLRRSSIKSLGSYCWLQRVQFRCDDRSQAANLGTCQMRRERRIVPVSLRRWPAARSSARASDGQQYQGASPQNKTSPCLSYGRRLLYQKSPFRASQFCDLLGSWLSVQREVLSTNSVRAGSKPYR